MTDLREFESVTRAARDALERSEPAAIASLVRVRGSTPRHEGARILIGPDGLIAGTIGGGTLEWRVIEQARLALAEHLPRYAQYVFDTRGGADSVGLCGGRADVHIDVQVSEFLDVAEAAARAVEAGETVVLASIVREGRAAPHHPATHMLIWPDGRTAGSVGDEALQARLIEEARAIFDSNKSRLATLSLGGDPDLQPVLVYLDLLQPDPTLLIIGAGHVAQPLAVMGQMVGMRVIVVDDRIEWANRERFPAPIQLGIVDYEPASETLGAVPVAVTPTTYVVITTWGYDLPAMAQVLKYQPAYIGLVGSPTKARVLFERLRQAGFTDEVIRGVKAPIGLDVGAESPSEIAVSILAEILTVLHRKTGQPLRQVRGRRLDTLFSSPSTNVAVNR